MTDDTPKPPLFGNVDIDSIAALTPTRAAPPAPKPKLPTPVRNLAWSTQVLPTLPVHLQWPIYNKLRQEVEAGHLQGWILRDQPIKLKVLVPRNGLRVRTFKQIVLRPGRHLQRQLDALYATVRTAQLDAEGARYLTLEEALELS